MCNENIDKQSLRDDFKIMFMRYQHSQVCHDPLEPVPIEKIVAQYNCDYVFRSVVDSLTYAAMEIIDKHI